MVLTAIIDKKIVLYVPKEDWCRIIAWCLGQVTYLGTTYATYM